ncbi:4Fe-4S binding protein, partial [Methanorbis rubei]
ACGNWGVVGDKAGKATFVEVCSEKGAMLFDGAVKAGAISSSAPDPKGLEIRGKIENVMIKMGKNAQAKQFSEAGPGLANYMEAASKCIKCYGCIENCPICSCSENCSTKNPELVRPGIIPPDFMFQMIRFSHIASSCINCGQCSELCPMDIPNSLYMHAQQLEYERVFGHKPGYDMTLPAVNCDCAAKKADPHVTIYKRSK